MKRYRCALAVLALLLPLVAFLGAGLGAYPVAPWEVPRALLDGGVSADVLRGVRFPRVALGLVVGAGLALAGAVLQGVFRNPLADPGLVGVTAGAAVGAAATLVLLGSAPFGVWALPIAAFAGGAAATAAVWRVAQHAGRVSTVALLLAGIALNSIAGAMIGMLIFLANDQHA